MKIIERAGSSITSYCINLRSKSHDEIRVLARALGGMWWWSPAPDGVWLCFLKRADAVEFLRIWLCRTG